MYPGLSSCRNIPRERSSKKAPLKFEGGEEKMNRAFDRITFDPQIMGGRACIRGMRIPVSVIVGQIAHGAPFEEILEGYPDLEREDIRQAIEYAAWLTQEQVFNL